MNTSRRSQLRSSLVDGDYWATCREEHKLRAAINGHGDVFPQAKMRVKNGRATFTRDGVVVWSCNASYVATHFQIQPV